MYSFPPLASNRYATTVRDERKITQKKNTKKNGKNNETMNSPVAASPTSIPSPKLSPTFAFDRMMHAPANTSKPK